MKKLINLVKPIILALLIASPCRGENSLKEEFLQEASKAWIGYLEQFHCVEATIKETQTGVDENGESFSESSESYALVNFPYQIGTDTLSDPNTETHSFFATNPRYRFYLDPDRENPDQWVIDEVVKMKDDVHGSLRFPRLNTVDSHRTTLELSYENRVLIGYAQALKLNFMFYFPSVVATDDFEITDIFESQEDGVRVVTVVYRHEPEGLDGTFGPAIPLSGSVKLLPENSWVIKNASFDMFDAGEHTATNKLHLNTNIEYHSLDDKFPLPARIVTTYESQGGKFSMEQNKDFSWKRNVEMKSRDEYYLSYYGFPEPKFEGDGDWRRHAIVLLGLVIVAAAYFVFQRRRNAKHRTEE